MANDLQTKVVITAENKTKGAFSEVSSSVKGLNKDVSGLTNLLGGAAIAGAVGLGVALVDMAKGASEAEVSFAKTQKTVENTFDAFNATQLNKIQAEVNDAFGEGTDVVEVYLEMIQDLSASTVKLGFDDEATAESIAKLFQRTGDLTEATNLNNLAMDLARAKSIDLETASNAIGMVLSGNTKILKQFVIEVDETKTPMEQLADLQLKVAGNAEAFSHTFQGQMLALSESISNLKDTIGSALLEAIQPFISELVTWANDPAVQIQVQQIAKAIGEFATTAIPVAIEAVKNLWTVLKSIVDIMTKIGETIIGAIDAIDKLHKKTSQITPFLQDLGKSAIAPLTATFNGAKNLLGFDSGGVVPGAIGAPTLAMVHGGETIIPTHKGGSVGGAVVNIYNPILLDDSMVQKMSEQVARQLRTQIKY